MDTAHRRLLQATRCHSWQPTANVITIRRTATPTSPPVARTREINLLPSQLQLLKFHMKKLYLDFNVVSYLRSEQHPLLTTAFNHVAKSQLVVFSPAHLEDIAASAMRDNTPESITNAEIDFLAKIAGRNALRPINNNELVFYNESPRDCYARVVKYYANNDWAESVEAEVIADAHEKPAGNPRAMNNIPPADVLKRLVYRKCIVRSLVRQGEIDSREKVRALSWQFEKIKNRFSVFEAYVNLAANLLEKIGYYREAKDRSRARLHDVSHIIYAAYCDTLVTEDRKLAKKAQAIYSLLGISTLVLSKKEFETNFAPPLLDAEGRDQADSKD